MDRALVDTSATLTAMPLDIAERHFYETPLETELRPGDGRVVRAKVFIAETEIEGRKGPAKIMTFNGAIPIIGIDTLETLGLRSTQ